MPIMSDNGADTLTLREPAYVKQHILWSRAYEASMLECIRRAQADLGEDTSARAILAHQLPVAMMMGRPNPFLWYVVF